MDIACPHCAATYRVPDSLVAGGKPLRCAACGGEWTPRPAAGPAPEPVPAPVAAAPKEASSDPAPATRPGSGLLPAAWIASLAAVGIAVTVVVLFRAEIAAAWPPFGRLLGG